MSKPSEKSPEIEKLITDATGKDRKSTIVAHRCMTCEDRVFGFRDALSRREYKISGMCQKCQDEVFD